MPLNHHFLKILKRKRSGNIVMTVGMLMSVLMMGGLSVDMAMYYNKNQMLRNAADAAALAGAQELYRSSSVGANAKKADAIVAAKSVALDNYDIVLQNSDVAFGFVDSQAGYVASNFSSASTKKDFAPSGGHNAVSVKIRAGNGEPNEAFPSLFNRFLGIRSYSSSSAAVAHYSSGANSATGLRPFYLCAGAYTEALETYSDATVPEITFYGDRLQVGTKSISSGPNSCDSMGPGNWGFTDYGQGNGASALAEVIENGWSQPVTLNTNWDATPGNKINSGPVQSAIQQLINDKTVITLPLYDTSSGNGNNAKFHVVQLAPFLITDYNAHGNNSYIRGRFQKQVCNAECTASSESNPSGPVSIKLDR